MANSDEPLLSVLETLEQCRATLRQCGKADTAQVVSVAILDLGTKLSCIEDAELKALCEAMLDPGPVEPAGPGHRRPQLRLVE